MRLAIPWLLVAVVISTGCGQMHGSIENLSPPTTVALDKSMVADNIAAAPDYTRRETVTPENVAPEKAVPGNVAAANAASENAGPANSAPDKTAPVNTAPDNTARNARDADPTLKTPFDQSENKRDLKVTADIRKRLVGTDNLSVNARNIKVITAEGKVTLRGPVNSDAERLTIVKIATELAGEENVDNQLEVKSDEPQR